jgi:two-component system OmpR family response regulator
MGGISDDMDFASRILVVDDDPGIRDSIARFLGQHGFAVDVAAAPEEMRARLARTRYDLIVLDVMMPGEDGLTALRRLAQDGPAPPVIMLSAVGTDVDRIVGLEMGADDYLVKPCNPRELLARIRTVLRRGAHGARAAARDRQEMRLAFAGWTLDPLTRQLTDPAGVLVQLSDGEFRLLLAFAEHPRRVLSRDQLLDYSRGTDTEAYDRAIDVQISRLRRKLAGEGEELIRTVRGEGYLFTAAVTRA